MKIYYKFKKILTISERWQMLILLHLMLISMILEAMGVGMILPSITMMTQPNFAQSYPGLQPLLKFFHYPSLLQLVAGGMILLSSIYIIKTSYLVFMIWKQNKFVYNLCYSLSNRLFKGYLEQPWAFHLQRNSAELVLNITNEVNLFVSTAVQTGMTLLTESLVVVGICALLLYIEPIGAFIVFGLLGLAVFAYYRIIRLRVISWGLHRQAHDGYKLQHLQQGLGGAKDVKILGREEYFINQYKLHNKGSTDINQKLRTLSDLPRLLLELLGIIGLTGIVLTMIAQGKPIEMLMPTLGVFAAGAFRLIPSLNRIMGAVQNLRYSFPIIDRLYSELQLIENTNAVNLIQKQGSSVFKQKITLKNICFKYNHADQYALENISFTIPKGTFIGFIGTSGAGKSTLVDIILGLLTPQTGIICMDDIDIQSNMRGWQNQIGYVPQSIFLTDDTLKRNVAFGLPDEAIDQAAVNRAIHAAQLSDFVDSLPDGLNTFVGERGVRLSGGQCQRIGIARALYHNPNILVLDEATSALDSETEQGVMQAVHALHGEKTVIIIAHRLSTVARCDWIYKMERGKIIHEGRFEDVINQDPTLINEKASNPVAQTTQ